MIQLDERVKDLAVEKYGPTLGLKPGIVAEVEFDNIQINKRTKANYTLHNPRFKTIHWEMSPRDTNTLNDVEQMFEEKLSHDRVKLDKNPAILF